MSWAVSLIGRPEAISAELDRYMETLTGTNRAEFDAAKPHLQALLRENFNKTSASQPLIHLEANGSGVIQIPPGGRPGSGIGVTTSRSCAVAIRLLSAKLV